MPSKFTRDAARVPSTARKFGQDLCPLCGSKVTYRGLTSLECAGAAREAVEAYPSYPGGPPPSPAKPAVPACPNYRVAETKPGDGGSIEWAQTMWDLGYVVTLVDNYGVVRDVNPRAEIVVSAAKHSPTVRFRIDGVRNGYTLICGAPVKIRTTSMTP